MNLSKKFLSVLLISLFVLIYCISFFFIKKNDILMIEKGNGIWHISHILKNNNNISSQKFFYYSCSLQNKVHATKAIQYGEYKINKYESLYSVCKKILNGNVLIHKIVFPEGLSTYQVVQMINNENYLSGDALDYQIEGSLMPSTYFFTKGMTKQDMLQKMIHEMDIFVKNAWKGRNKEFLNSYGIKNIENLITLASIIEKETADPKERNLIAGLYYNRLKINMPLQADPTVQYGVTHGMDLDRIITRDDYKIKNNYNTYQKYGLPVGPICNPGKDSIVATLNPTMSKYLYFVVKPNSKSHIFAETFRDHQNNVIQYKRHKYAK